VLVFLPKTDEIRTTTRQIENITAKQDLLVLPLYGELPSEEQDRALAPAQRRKVVLATNVAETSITVPGVEAVVDTGFARIPRFDPAIGLNRLERVRISKASAEQRAGRAGRTQPGLCVRLWSQREHAELPERTEPEIRRVDLSGALLQLLAFGERDVQAFPWFEPPAAAQIRAALSLLGDLGALSEHGLTESGKRLARLPMHPRLGRLLAEGHRLGIADWAAWACVLLSERDPAERPRQETEPRGARRAPCWIASKPSGNDRRCRHPASRPRTGSAGTDLSPIVGHPHHRARSVVGAASTR
jgi:ATP-dependent helicase HrpB